MKAKILAVASQKGGVGKTTTVLTVGKELARRGKKVLLVDVDGQASLTEALTVLTENQKTIVDFLGFLEKPAPFDDVVIRFDDVDLIPSSIALFNWEQGVVAKPNKDNLLKKALNNVRDKYDYIIIDCPPSLGVSMTNALLSSDKIIIPVRSDGFSVIAFRLFVDTLISLADAYDKDFDIAGVLLTMVQQRTKEFKEIKQVFEKETTDVGIKLFDTIIRNSVKGSMAYKGISIVDTNSGVGEDYKVFVDELLRVVE